MIEFHIPVYDGPLDLLLALIQKGEMNIYNIDVSVITDQFLDYIHKAKELGLQDLSAFYREAAELIWIKSQMMLPVQMEMSDEYVDPREELVERLLEYSKFKKYSELLLGNESSSDLPIERKPSEFILPFADDELWEDVDCQKLLDTFVDMMNSYNVIDEKVFNIYEEVNEKEKISLMNELFEKSDTIMFSDLFKKKNTPIHIVCSFLAVLEAVKDKMVLVDQPVLFGDMTLTKRPADWNPNLADEYDSQYDEIVNNNLQDEDDFSVIGESADEEESETDN